MAVELVTLGEFEELFTYFTKTSYEPKKQDRFGASVMEKCEKLFAKDYTFSIISNTSGELCNSYPSRIVYLEREKSNSFEDTKEPDEENNNINEAASFREQVLKSRIARCRTRFPVPVILLDGKFICRSATLSCGKELYSRMSLQYLFGDETPDAPDKENNVVDEYEEVGDPPSTVDPAKLETLQNEEESTVGEYRNQDAQLLRELAITNICDLMMEDRKVKYMFYFSSSEKADKNQRYRDFTILSMPYPGCEFFQKFRELDFLDEKMRFDWNQSYIKRKLQLPQDSISSLGIDWAKYKEWHLNTLTQNYMKVLLKNIVEGTSSMLIHCISGWDRTPLFISMLRMSLWADGKIHQSLNTLEMLYLTVGYDWFLFGHQLKSRLDKREEIMQYCFFFLKFLRDDEFSVFNNEQINNGEKRPNSPVETDENLSSAAESNRNSNTGDIAMMRDWAADPALSPNRNRQSSPLEKRESSFSFIENLEDLAVMQCNTPPNVVQNREDELSIPVPDIKSTSPLSVPSGSRQRTESTSSDISYHMISGTGSIPRSSISSPPPELNQFLRSIDENYQEISREDKLDALRATFMKIYFTAANFRFKSGSGTGVLGYFNQFTEKVGIRTPKVPS